MEIVEGQIGAGGKYDLKIEGGKLVFDLGYAHAPGEVALVAKADLGQVLDLIAAKIPGHFDDAILEAAKALLAVAK